MIPGGSGAAIRSHSRFGNPRCGNTPKFGAEIKDAVSTWGRSQMTSAVKRGFVSGGQGEVFRCQLRTFCKKIRFFENYGVSTWTRVRDYFAIKE